MDQNNPNIPRTPPPVRPVGGSAPVSLVFSAWMSKHWKGFTASVIGIILLLVIIFQIVYPSNRMLPGAKVDGVSVGWMQRDDAAKKIDGYYANMNLQIFFGNTDAAFEKPKMSEVGIITNNFKRLNAFQYPFILKLVPFSFLAMNSQGSHSDLDYEYDQKKIEEYTTGKVGETCKSEAQDATLRLIENQLQIVPSTPGIECDITKFQQKLREVKPIANKESEVKIESTEFPARVGNEEARKLADRLNDRLAQPLPIDAAGSKVEIPGRIVMSWLDFYSDIPPEGVDRSNRTARLGYKINSERMMEELSAKVSPKVEKRAGITTVSTLDFKVTARKNATPGKELDVDKTATAVKGYIDKRTETAKAITKNIPPSVEYTRKYTPTIPGFKALVEQFAHDKKGDYAINLEELTGLRKKRGGAVNIDKQFEAGGIESLYMAYAVKSEERSGWLRPIETISGGKAVGECFNDMLVESDRDCLTGFYTFLGHARTMSNMKNLGLKKTTFRDNGSKTTARELHTFMVRLSTNKAATKIEGGPLILNKLREGRFSEGVPKAVEKGEVAQMTGEIRDYKNVASLVFTPKGTYALTVMSKGSSWELIQELTSKIQELKERKVPKELK